MSAQPRQIRVKKQKSKGSKTLFVKKALKYILIGAGIALVFILGLLHSYIQLLIVAGVQAIAGVSIENIITVETFILANLTAFIATYDFIADRMNKRSRNIKRSKSEE